MDLNTVSLTGRLGADPQVRFFANEKCVCHMRVAVTKRKRKDEAEAGTAWIDVAAWNRTAELCGQYLTKGRRVAITGRLDYETWEDRNGNKRSKVLVVAEEVCFIDSAQGGSPGDQHPAEQRQQSAATTGHEAYPGGDDEPPF